MKIDSRYRLILNGLLFQVNWFSCILVGGHFAVLTTVVLLLVHFLWVSRAPCEWLLMIAFSSVGFLLDTALMHAGLIQFSSSILWLIAGKSFYFAPLWLLLLWLSFSTCLHHALLYLHTRKKLAVCIVLVAIPVNYFLGAKLTGAILSDPIYIPLAMITLYWMILLPITLTLANRCVRK